jgi:hypothetical protein
MMVKTFYRGDINVDKKKAGLGRKKKTSWRRRNWK